MFVTLMVGALRSLSAPLRAHRRHFLALMAGAPGSLALAPPGAPLLTFLSIDGGCYRISSSDTSQGARRRRFLALMVDAPGSPAPAPPGAVIDVS
jgi:hypothetical protein